jgi:hypothetical protein
MAKQANIQNSIQSTAIDVVISASASESEAVYLAGSRLLGVITPALETGTAKFGFLASHDGVTWTTQYVQDQYGAYLPAIADPTKTYPVSIDPAVLYPWAHVKLVALDAAGVAKVQTSARTFKFLYGPL